MTIARRLRIALLAHSANPRGGVVHAIELAEALVQMGHDVVLHAPGTAGSGFFRPIVAKAIIVPATPVGSSGGLHGHVLARIEDYVRHFAEAAHRQFDLYHAGDGLSANALLTLKTAGLIPAYARTVHHLDRFADQRVTDLDRRSIAGADALLAVSQSTNTELVDLIGRPATVVGNGVNPAHFSTRRTAADGAVAIMLGDREGPLFLSVGGVEARKNSRTALAAFLRFRAASPSARWVIAGGASLIDHGAYQAAFDQDLAEAGLPDGAVLRLGPVQQDLMPALYRRADALLFPSTIEGFGLAVLEAMACGTPAIVSRMAPFTEYLQEDDALWCDPSDAASLAEAMSGAMDPSLRHRLIARGRATAGRHSWARTAIAHLPVYQQLLEAAYA